MNKSAKIFVKIIYYVFTFALGILIAVASPYYYYIDAHMDVIAESLEAREFTTAMSMVGGYYNREYVFREDLPGGGGIVLFEATVLDSGGKEDVADSHLHKSYAGFLYGVKDTYAVTAAEDNRTSLIVTTDEGDKAVSLVAYDSDADGKADSVSTLHSHGFLLIDLDQAVYGSVHRLTFTDHTGDAAFTFAPEQALRYDGSFFEDVDAFVTEYNRDYRSERLTELNNAFLMSNGNYTRSSVDVEQGSAVRKSVTLVVIYFAIVYLIADLLLGKRFVIRFFKWVLVKVFKVKFKEKGSANPNEVFGSDYYSRVTVTLKPDFEEDFTGDATLTIAGDGGTPVEFELTRGAAYTAQKRLHAGTYHVLGLDLPEGYEPASLPEVLTVEGYTTAFPIEIKKKT